MSNVDVSALERSLSTLNVLLDGAIAFVVIGLVLEYAPILWSELTSKVSAKFKASAHVIEKTGEVLVILGVAGELAMHIWSSQMEDKIKSAQRDQISAQQRTIEQLLSHRILSQEQKEKLALVAKKFPSLNFQTITVLENEPWDFVTQIGSFLESQGWHWLPCVGANALPSAQGKPTSCWTVMEGIQIDGAAESAPVVNALAEALRDPNIVGMGKVTPEIKEAFPTVVIMVGTKL
jgi:hypothetical protein